LLVDSLAAGEGGLSDEGATATFAADETHGLELRVDARGGDECKAFAGGEPSVGGQTGARRQATCADVSGERIDQLLVSSLDHGGLYP
jgi:hypothetical protein